MSKFAKVDLSLKRDADGSIVLESNHLLEMAETTIVKRLEYWASREPGRIFLRERVGSEWTKLTYAQAWEGSGRIATGLLQLGCSNESPLLILAGNSIVHAMHMLGSMRAGIPVAPVSPSYAGHGNYDRLGTLAKVAGAKAAYVGPEINPSARAAMQSWGLQLISENEFDGLKTDWEGLSAAERDIEANTVAKLMFTSGSTGTPKAVINTHKMMVANQLQLAAIWGTATAQPLALVDWLPWSHTFGGNFVFNMALWHGGCLSIDDGRPTPGHVGKTLSAMADVGPSRYFSVPAGYEALIPAMEANPELTKLATRNLEFVFCAAAALPASTRNRLQNLLRLASGRDIPVIGGWGSTETAPCATAVHFPNEHAGNLGVPLPGVGIKLIPHQDNFELRVRGPNITPGYWREPEATHAAFDDEGYYRIGDAAKFVDDLAPEKGLVFDGRISENFKLATGTWVNVGVIRLAIIAAGHPYVRDAVITGHDRGEIGALLFVDDAACALPAYTREAANEVAASASLRQILDRALSLYNETAGGSSARIARFCVEASPPSVELGETTDKGYINQRAVVRLRADTVAKLYSDDKFRVQG